MEQEFFVKNTDGLIYLISCALNGKVPEKERVASFDLSKVYKLAKFHSLEAVSYGALESYLNAFKDEILDIPEEIQKKWSSRREASVKKDVMFSFEREKLFAFLEKEGIWYLPLKGIYLREMYPVHGWRHLADNDILFDMEYREKIRDYMVENGYTVKVYGISAHDVYLKPPFYNFEMHIYLFKNTSFDERLNELYLYYKDIKEKLVKDEKSNYGYRMRNEDFYIYNLAHAYKHHLGGGTGLRTFVDTFVMLRSFGNTLDREYIAAELEKLGMTEFEENVRVLSKKLFSPETADALTDEEREMLLYYSSSGTYGVLKNTVNKMMMQITEGKEGERISLWMRIKYCFGRVFPSMDYYKDYYPHIYKNKLLIPGFVIKRFFKGVFVKGTAKNELTQLSRLKKIEKRQK